MAYSDICKNIFNIVLTHKSGFLWGEWEGVGTDSGRKLQLSLYDFNFFFKKMTVHSNVT